MSSTTTSYPSIAYKHEKCGSVTSMSSSIVETMVLDPYFHASGLTMCANCGEVLDEDCTIVASGQNLADFCKQLKASKGADYHLVRWGIYIAMMAIGAIVAPYMGAAPNVPLTTQWVCGAVMGGGVAFFVAPYIRLALCRAKII